MPAHAAALPRPLVSIVMPCHIASAAQAALLDETLRTVAGQTCPDCEVILVDDGSPIPIAPVADAHPRTRTVRQDNAGPAQTRNTGIALAGASYTSSLKA